MGSVGMQAVKQQSPCVARFNFSQAKFGHDLLTIRTYPPTVWKMAHFVVANAAPLAATAAAAAAHARG